MKQPADDLGIGDIEVETVIKKFMARPAKNPCKVSNKRFRVLVRKYRAIVHEASNTGGTGRGSKVTI